MLHRFTRLGEDHQGQNGCGQLVAQTRNLGGPCVKAGESPEWMKILIAKCQMKLKIVGTFC